MPAPALEPLPSDTEMQAQIAQDPRLFDNQPRILTATRTQSTNAKQEQNTNAEACNTDGGRATRSFQL